MTEVTFYTAENGDIQGFHVKGHSGYAKQGEDIVCAAISSAVYLVMNTVTDVMNIEAQAEAENGDAVFRVKSNQTAACRDIMQGLKLHLLSLEEQYGKFIHVKNTEV